MELLKKYILENGKSIDSNIVKVDNFLNHQIDIPLMLEIGKNIKQKFKGYNITKILTIEASGIAIGFSVALEMGLPLVFAKKKLPNTMNNFYTAKVFSFTKNQEYNICVGKEFINKNDKILIVDDFLARGNAVLGLKEIIEQAGATLVGVGIAIGKEFQSGKKKLEDLGIKVEVLANIESINGKNIIFK